MAKLKFLRNLEAEIGAFQDGFYALSVKKNGTEGKWVNDSTDVKIIVEGSGLKEAKDESELFSAGKITDLTAVNADGKVVLDISDLNLKAAKLSAAFAEGGVMAAIQQLMKSDDSAIGTGKSDFVLSGSGDDVLTGKGGSDVFIFQELNLKAREAQSSEFDTITDFDTKGDDMDFLEGNPDIANVKGTHQGQDALITFDDGSKLLLEDVTKKEFNAYLDQLQTT
jgi:Ca2+-binding RTX toxin-like protein